jgi:hypothetical protein
MMLPYWWRTAWNNVRMNHVVEVGSVDGQSGGLADLFKVSDVADY